MRFSCTILIFSGRPNPVWTIDDTAIQQSLLEQLQQLLDRAPAPNFLPKLGYQGCRFQIDDEHWAVQQGVVWQEVPQSKRVLSDTNRRFEKALLATAPETYSTLINSILSTEF